MKQAFSGHNVAQGCLRSAVHTRSPTGLFSPWLGLACLLLIAGVVGPLELRGQPTSLTNLRGEGLDPDGELRSVGNRTVWVRDRGGTETVVRVLCEVGEDSVVLLPSGELLLTPTEETRATALRFQGASKKELAEALLAGKFRGFQARQSANHLYIYDCSEDFLAKAAAILEATHAGVYQYFSRHGFSVSPPEIPLVVVIFRKQEDLRKYGHMPKEILAYYDAVSNHTYLFEEAEQGHLAPHRTQSLIFSTVAHEGVHQTLHNIGVQQRLSRWPMWISEGLPEYFAPTTQGTAIHWKGLGKTNDFRFAQLRPYLAEVQPETARLVKDTVHARRLDSSGYAIAWGMTHYLAIRHPEAFLKYLKLVSQRKALGNGKLRGLEEACREDIREFAKYFGRDFSQLEMSMVKHLKGLSFQDPAAKDKHYLLLVEYVDKQRLARKAGTTLSPEAIRKWQATLLEDLTPTQRLTAKFRIIEFPTKRAAEIYARGWLRGAGTKVINVPSR